LYTGTKGHEYELLFHSVFQNSCQLLNINEDFFQDATLLIDSDLPVGTGLGASAALCVAVTKLFHQLEFLSEHEIYDFALKMENIFHGESSGVDIAVSLMGSGMVFQRGVKREALKSDWQPHLYVSYSGHRGMTFDCIEKVKTLTHSDHALGHQIDMEMRAAVDLALKSFRDCNIEVLIQSIETAQKCFSKWDLCPASMQKEMDRLKALGALAVKPTGSGGGGFILSLWSAVPDQKLVSELKLMSCF
ncbi:MAG: mevalonate kinase, partial [Pseudobdellovibrionaceae bacterium]